MSIAATIARRVALVPALLALLLALDIAGPSRALAQDATPIAAPTPTPDPLREPLERAIDYLLAQQGEDGGFVGVSGIADAGTTTDAVVALKAAGFRGIAVDPAIAEALGYLEGQAAAYAATGPGQAAKLALAVVAGGRDPRTFGGVNLLAAATAPVAATPAAGTPAVAPALTGVYGDDLFDHALVMLALAAARQPVPQTAIEALRAAQLADGSWGFAGATEPGTGDSNTTALVVQALVATGNGTDPMVARALDYLKTVETIYGQFAYQASDPLVADANSTALAVQAIVAAGQDPTSADWRNAARGLAAFQNVSGAFRYQDAEPADNLLATLQAVPALAGVPLPVGVACEEEAPEAAPGATPVIELPAPGRGREQCVAIERAA